LKGKKCREREWKMTFEARAFHEFSFFWLNCKQQTTHTVGRGNTHGISDAISTAGYDHVGYEAQKHTGG
jgi:hypothetical protein